MSSDAVHHISINREYHLGDDQVTSVSEYPYLDGQKCPHRESVSSKIQQLEWKSLEWRGQNTTQHGCYQPISLPDVPVSSDAKFNQIVPPEQAPDHHQSYATIPVQLPHNRATLEHPPRHSVDCPNWLRHSEEE